MKILLVVNDISGTHGWSTYTLNLINSLRAHGHEAVVALKENDIYKKNVRQYVVFSHGPKDSTYNPIRLFRMSLKLKKCIDIEKPDVIHFVVEPYVLLLAFFGVKQPVVLTIHGTYAYIPTTLTGTKRLISKLLFSLANKKISHVISVSNKTKERYLKSCNSPQKISVIHNSVVPQDNTSLTKSKEQIHVITVGSVKARKGIYEAIYLLGEWSKKRQVKIIYDVVGKEEHERYANFVHTEAEKRRHQYFSTIFHGKVSESEKKLLFGNANAYIHLEPLSVVDVEGFGIGIIEAATHGVPSIVSRDGAVAEAVIDGETGYHVTIENHEQVFRALDDILVNAKISQKEVKNWANKHSPEAIFKQIFQIYKLVS